MNLLGLQQARCRITRPWDAPHEERLALRWHKMQHVCREKQCPRRAFTKQILEVPAAAAADVALEQLVRHLAYPHASHDHRDCSADARLPEQWHHQRRHRSHQPDGDTPCRTPTASATWTTSAVEYGSPAPAPMLGRRLLGITSRFRSKSSFIKRCMDANPALDRHAVTQGK
jgi:hypothetical protein